MSQTRKILTDNHWHRCLHCLYRGRCGHQYIENEGCKEVRQTAAADDYGLWRKFYDTFKVCGPALEDQTPPRYTLDEVRQRIRDRSVETELSAKYTTQLKSPLPVQGSTKVHWISNGRSESCGRLSTVSTQSNLDMSTASVRLFDKVKTSSAQTQCNSCLKKEVEQLHKSTDKRVYVKLADTHVSTADSRIQKLMSKKQDFFSGSIKTSGYRCGDGPSQHCQKTHYVRDFFLKWNPPQQTSVNHMLNDLKMELKKKNFKLDSMGSWMQNSRFSKAPAEVSGSPSCYQDWQPTPSKSIGRQSTACNTYRKTFNSAL